MKFATLALLSLISSPLGLVAGFKYHPIRRGLQDDSANATALDLFAPTPGRALFHSSTGTPCTTTLSAGADIQMAIGSASSGDVICLEPGLYKPSTVVTIDKSIELRGPQSHVDPRPNSSCKRFPIDEAIEAVIDGEMSSLNNIFLIEANDVTIDGLMTKNSSRDMIYADGSPDVERTSVRYNIITKSGDEGVQLKDCADCVVEYNHVFDTEGDGINMCCGSSDGKIQFNEVHDIRSGNAAIWAYSADGINIMDNMLYNVPNNDGIKMGGSSSNSCSSFSLNGSILRNLVYNTAQDAITVYSSNTDVMDNEVFDNFSENGSIYIGCSATMNVNVERNLIHLGSINPSSYAVRVGKSSEQPDASTIKINDNCIEDNRNKNGLVLVNDSSQTLDATANWWGASDGPSGDKPGSGERVEEEGTGSPIVNVSGFLDEAPDTCQRTFKCRPQEPCTKDSTSKSTKSSKASRLRA